MFFLHFRGSPHRSLDSMAVRVGESPPPVANGVMLGGDGNEICVVDVRSGRLASRRVDDAMVMFFFALTGGGRGGRTGSEGRRSRLRLRRQGHVPVASRRRNGSSRRPPSPLPPPLCRCAILIATTTSSKR